MLKKILSLPALFAIAFAASVAQAQDADVPPTSADIPQTSADVPHSAADIDEATKEKFVETYTDIMEIQMRYAQQLQDVTDEADANALQQQAQIEMQEAVTANDMSIQEYNQIIQLASADPELMEELEAAIEAHTGS